MNRSLIDQFTLRDKCTLQEQCIRRCGSHFRTRARTLSARCRWSFPARVESRILACICMFGVPHTRRFYSRRGRLVYTRRFLLRNLVYKCTRSARSNKRLFGTVARSMAYRCPSEAPSLANKCIHSARCNFHPNIPRRSEDRSHWD